MCLCLPIQKLSKAVAEILEYQHMVNERGQVSVMGTDFTSSVCLPLNWWERRTSPVRRTTSGQLRNPVVFVSYWITVEIRHTPCAHVHEYNTTYTGA